MATRELEQINIIPQGRLAPIFLSHERRVQDWDLFTYSQFFHEQHRDILQSGYGIISSLRQTEDVHSPTSGFHETIVFDARSASKEAYNWEVCYASEPGVQEVVLLRVSEDMTEGRFAKTSNQGRYLPWASFNLSPEETFEAERHLLGRLESPEVQEGINKIYSARLGIESTITRAVNKQAAEDRKTALELKVHTPPSTEEFAQRVEARVARQRSQLESLGFPPLLLFRVEWLEE